MKAGFNLLGEKHKVFTYQLKDGTKSSFYLVDGEKEYLPFRLSLSKEQFKEVKHSGSKETKGQMKSTFSKKQTSIYKQHKPFNFHSNIWLMPEAPYFFGFGDVGITNEKGKTTSTGDLLLVMKTGRNLVQIHLFLGMADEREKALEFFKMWQKRKD